MVVLLLLPLSLRIYEYMASFVESKMKWENKKK